MTEERKKLIELRKLKKYFPVSKGLQLKAVEDVSFVIYEGEKFGVVGESGCGKSTLGRTILQLYQQTSGSCVYYGKSIQEMNPVYIRKELEKLPTYQKDASSEYQKSLGIDLKIEKIAQQASQLDPEGSPSDAKKYDVLQKESAKLEFESKELKKEASRSLREGSRTVGSLILCKDIEAIRDLFLKAEEEVKAAHDSFKKYLTFKNQYDENKVLLDAIDHTDERIQEVMNGSLQGEEKELNLKDLQRMKKTISKVNKEDLIKTNEQLVPKMEAAKKEAAGHHEKEMEYRHQAFDTYQGKDILPITERTLDKAYQEKLQKNYETGLNLNKLSKEELRSIRPDMQMVFQDPAASIDPRQTIGATIEEPLRLHTTMSRDVRKQKTLELLRVVDLKPEYYYSYPNSLSGGMKQRAGIARAIAMDPSFVVLDEAVSALDVSVQAQILQLLNQLQQEKHLTYLFITHDLGVVKHFCDRVLVMYLGNVCELANSEDLFAHPLHPYTESLLKAVPHLDPENRAKEDEVLQGEVPSPINPPSGCPFHTRCNRCMDICSQSKPNYVEYEPGHFVACHLYNKKEKETK